MSFICGRRSYRLANEPENTLIIGYYGRKNYGDDLLLDVAKKIYGQRESVRYLSTEDIAMTDDSARQLMTWADRLILFGGEVLNSYFLDKLIFLKTFALDVLRRNVLFYAVGVSHNEENIQAKLTIFESIIFRTSCKPIAGRTLPDPTFLIAMPNAPAPINRGGTTPNVAYFLSQTSNMPIDSIVEGIRAWQQRGARIYLFTMCNRDSQAEDDRLINTEVMRAVENVHFVAEPKDILGYMRRMDYAVCWRFHAHIFCIRYHVPFLSIANTPKVINLLKDNNLSHLHQPVSPSSIQMLVQNALEIRQRLARVNTVNERLARGYREPLDPPRATPHFYIRPDDSRIIDGLIRDFPQNIKEPELAAQTLLALITGSCKTEYQWGLAEKFRAGATILTLRGDISWLVNAEIARGSPSFYARMAAYLGIDEIIYPLPTGLAVNIDYMDQNDMRGCHRSGWQYVIDNIKTSNHSSAILCDMYLDRTFHWNLEVNRALAVVPYRKAWIGFIHHTCSTEYSPYNTSAMFQRPEFITSLRHCRGLYVLSEYLQRGVRVLLDQVGYGSIPVTRLMHPTEPSTVLFNLDPTDMRVTQVGAWYRDISAIFRLSLGRNSLKFRKYALVGPNMEGYYAGEQCKPQISRDALEHAGVSIEEGANTTLLSKLNNQEYDEMFSKSLIFIRLLDASAVNTIIEAIMRNTPILVNRLEAVREYLGERYPLYYDTMEEASALLNNMRAIRAAHTYLRRMDKRPFMIETFQKRFWKSLAR